MNDAAENGSQHVDIADSFTKQKIVEAIADYSKFTCVRWIPRTNERDYVQFQSSERGCFAPIGKFGNMQKLNLGSGCGYKGTAIHEMLHTIGFGHEQGRNDRDDHITVHWDNIQNGGRGQFNKLNARVEDQLDLPYDFSSVMHYGQWAFSKGGVKTITTVDPANQSKIGQRAGFSKQDIKEVNRLYRCKDSGNGAGPETGGGKPSIECKDEDPEYCEMATTHAGGHYCKNDKNIWDYCKKSCHPKCK